MIPSCTKKQTALVNMLVLSVVDMGVFQPDQVKPKTIKYIIITSPPNMQYYSVRAHTGWLEIRIMCQSGATCVSADCCFSQLAL